MGRRSMVLAAAVWLAVVAVVSVATWTVIDAAGRDVTARPGGDPAAAAGASGTRSTPSRSRTPGPSPTGASTPTRTTPVPPSTNASPEPQERTWAGSAGSVSARCTGGDIDLLSASPANGWRMEVDERGPSRVRVEFRGTSTRSGPGSDDGGRAGGGDGDDGGGDKVEVRAQCGGDVPRFRLDS